MISEGPALIEALPGELQNGLNGALHPDEVVLIAVRGNAREAFAATADRLLVLKEGVLLGGVPVEVREVPLDTVSEVRAEPRPVGGRLRWETTANGAPTAFEYPTYDSSKYELVAKRLREMISQRKPTTVENAGPAAGEETIVPAAAPRGGTDRNCPKCSASIPAEGSWCPQCGLQVSDPCWECGRPLATGTNFCAHCGTPNTEPAVVQCPNCKVLVARGHVFCTACGAQARVACQECERPMRRDWTRCPACSGEPEWEESGVGQELARLRGDEPEDPSAWLQPAPRPRDAEDLNARGAEAYEAGNYREAVRLFQEAIDTDPSNASFYTNLGVAYGEVGDDLQAFAAYRKAIELNPKEIAAYANMGYLYMERERHAEAREMWEKVIRLAPDSEEAREARENLRGMDQV